MAGTVKPIPEQYRSVTPNLIFHHATASAIEFYKKAFGATELGGRASGPNGSIMHAELKIGDSVIFLNDTMSQAAPASIPSGHPPVYLHLYVPDADAVFKHAVAEGARVEMPLQDMFWGDRYGQLTDPFGHRWAIATHKEDLSAEEIAKRQAAFFAKSAGSA